MNFEEIESTWNQQVAPSPAPDPAILGLRSRMLAYAAGSFAFGLLVYPLLSWANFRYLHPASPTWFWFNVALREIVALGLFAYALRRIAQHRRLRRESTATLRDYSTVLLTATEAEMRDTRLGTWLIPLFVVLALLSGYQNNAATYGWHLFVTQAGVLAAIVLPVLGAVWSRYARTLKPEQARLRALLREME